MRITTPRPDDRFVRHIRIRLVPLHQGAVQSMKYTPPGARSQPSSDYIMNPSGIQLLQSGSRGSFPEKVAPRKTSSGISLQIDPEYVYHAAPGAASNTHIVSLILEVGSDLIQDLRHGLSTRY